MTSRDIEVTFGGRSREHVSRLMKKLFDDGLVERNTANRPYTYSITDNGKNHIGEENLVYAVSGWIIGVFVLDVWPDKTILVQFVSSQFCFVSKI